MFKNGLAVISCEVRIPGPGSYIIADAPRPIHGSFWVTSGEDVNVRCGYRRCLNQLLAPPYPLTGGSHWSSGNSALTGWLEPSFRASPRDNSSDKQTWSHDFRQDTRQVILWQLSPSISAKSRLADS